ncbi:c-type cytochrome [bacterium]|nr:c-type cytochrome [bacterium]
MNGESRFESQLLAVGKRRYIHDCWLSLATVVVLAVVVASNQAAAEDSKPAQDPNVFRTTIRPTDPLSAEDELRTFSVPDGFEVQLVAAEPQIAKPMNLAFDARGRIWVTDSVEYPIPAPADRASRDSIKVLEDTNGDGRADRVTTFADGLNIPIGLYPYRDGVVCFSIPDILFLRDTDGDGKADQRERLVGPFDTTRDTHGMCNAFTRGFDGWLYACHGFNNRSEVAGRDGHVVLMQSGNTFRLRLDGSRIEQHTHGQVNPFGMAFNSDGDLFSADCHTKPVTLLLAGGCYESFGKPHDGLGYVPNVMDHLHGSTAIGGICLIEDDHWPDEFRGNAFGGNVMTSRVNRNSLVYSGSSIRAKEEPDFLIATDPWFRPVDLQLGPDGALYIADFYNRIIGHYEVPLDHPGRDRHSGRIWRVVYKGSAAAGGAGQGGPPAARPADFTKLGPAELVEQLAESNLTRRMLMADRLTDHFGEAAVAPARIAFADVARSADVRVHCLWVLQRLGALTADELQMAIAAESPERLRIHGFRVLSAAKSDDGRVLGAGPVQLAEWLHQGFADPSPLVRRAAVMASAQHLLDANVAALISLFGQTPESDVHLRYVIRMALRDHLATEGRFAVLHQQPLDQAGKQLVADVCLALNNEAAGTFLLQHVTDVEISDRTKLADVLRQIATTVSGEQIAQVVTLAQQRFHDDTRFQLDLLTAVKKGLDERGVADASVQKWAAELAQRLLNVDLKPEDAPAEWTFLPVPGKPDRGDPWTITNRRNSADGQKASLLFSSFPRGEQWTGIYRSVPFEVGDSFSFWAAGHIGHPGQPVHAENFIRMRDAGTLEILHETTPPRNDVAQRTEWDTKAERGRRVIIELVDGDTDSAYAWLAVGRFSAPRLNPSAVPEERRQAALLILQFQLKEFVDDLRSLLRTSTDRNETTRMIGMTLGLFAQDSRLVAVSEALKLQGVSQQTYAAAVSALVNDDASAAPEILKQSMKAATAAEQQRIADQLLIDGRSMTQLIDLVETGAASARLLTRPAVAQKVTAAGTAEQKERVRQLTESLPSEDAGLAELIMQRRAAFGATESSALVGVELFKKNCSVCHQVADQGKKVGPNLDGIGNRGLDRLVEDVLAPNRNVDVAFRSTTIVTIEGKVISGLIKRTEGEQIILVDSKGEEIPVAKKTIDEQFPSALSPMPANFGESLTEQDFRQVMAYLLSLRGGSGEQARESRE